MPDFVVKIDSVGALRYTQKQLSPDPVTAALLAELAGADGIAAYLREDRKYIHDRDIRILRSVVQTKLVLLMGFSSEMAGIALNVKPDRVTLVPEKREEFSAEGAMDLIVHQSVVSEAVDTLQDGGIPVAIFIDPDPEQIKLAHQVGAAMVEINTAPFCSATTTMRKNQSFIKIVDAVKLAHKLKRKVVVGRGLSYHTIRLFTDIGEIDEYCIGHSIISRAVLKGMETAVRDMRDQIK
jgi:pyridoxine 5-phosphate synthase